MYNSTDKPMTLDDCTGIIKLVFTAARNSHQDGDLLIRALEVAIEKDAWREYQRPMGEIQTYGPGEFTKFVTTPPSLGMGMDPTRLIGVITAFGRDDLRERVEGLLRADIPPARAQGEIGNGRSRLRDTKSTSEQDDVSYVVARLKRDNPDIALLIRELGKAPALTIAHAQLPATTDTNDALRVAKKQLINQLVNKLARETDMPYGHIHGDLNRLCGDRLGNASLETLDKRILELQSWL